MKYLTLNIAIYQWNRCRIWESVPTHAFVALLFFSGILEIQFYQHNLIATQILKRW